MATASSLAEQLLELGGKEDVGRVFVQSVLAFLGLRPERACLRRVLACALAVTAAEVAKSLLRVLTAVPDAVRLLCAWLRLRRERARQMRRMRNERDAGAPLGWLARAAAAGLLAALRRAGPTATTTAALQRWLAAVGTRVARLHVPEKCGDDWHSRPNLAFDDLAWYMATHTGSAALDDALAVQESAAEAVVLRARGGKRAGSPVFREYEHAGCVVGLELGSELRTRVLTEVEVAYVNVTLAHPPGADGAALLQSFLAAVRAARQDAQAATAWRPTVHHYRAGEWKGRPTAGRKTFEHVAMREADRRALTADLAAFLESEARYASMGVAWTRGYLLHGPPGCGKSSCIAAMSATHRLPLYVVNLRSVESDEKLLAMFASLPERVLVVMEDVDAMTPAVLARSGLDGVAAVVPTPVSAAAPAVAPTASAVATAAPAVAPAVAPTASTAAATKGVSLGALLNVLDGIEAGAGRVLVMTTNRKHLLDPALIRPGRCDVHLELGYCTDEHVLQLARVYLGDADAAAVAAGLPPDALDGADVTPADVAGLLLPLATARPKADNAARTFLEKLTALCEAKRAATTTATTASCETCDPPPGTPSGSEEDGRSDDGSSSSTSSSSCSSASYS